MTRRTTTLLTYPPLPSGTIFIRGGQTIADVVVVGVTWKATREARSEGSMSSLMGVMFKNGKSASIRTAIVLIRIIGTLYFL